MDTAEYMHNGGRHIYAVFTPTLQKPERFRAKAPRVKIVDRLYQGIKARGIKPQKIILYGSYASDSNWEDSDIDIIVISDDFIGKGDWERIDILTDVICEIFAPIEAVAMTQEEWDQGELFVTDFVRNGEVLFAA